MKQTKKLLFIYFASLVFILGVNLLGNYSYYAAGNDWHFSVYFTIGMTTFCWIIFTVLYMLVFKRFVWSDRPTLKIILGSLIFAIAGAGAMLVAMKAVQWSHHFGEQSVQDTITNCIYSALFSMIIGLMITGQQSLIHLKKSIEDNEQMKREMVQSQFETLKSQVNPHFLFNSLNTLTVMIPKQPDVSVKFVEQMSKVFRYSLQHRDDNTIDVGTELKVVQSYLFLNEQRYDGKLKVNINIGASALAKKIITQSLLMLVENAIKHNELSHENPLTVRIYDEQAHLVVENSLQRKSQIEHSTNIGLDNIKKRYALASDIPVVIEEKKRPVHRKDPIVRQMNILILEDEKAAATRLQQLLKEVVPDTVVVAVIESVKEAKAWFKDNTPPELILSDIQLADGLSLDLFRQVSISAPVIFTTAYDAYTLRAFKLNSIDYLLKPIDREELKAAFAKYHSLHAQKDTIDKKFLDLFQNIASGKASYKSRFLIRQGDRLLTIPADEVAYVRADDKVVFLHTKSGQKHIIDDSLDELEAVLDPNVFFRINRTYIAPLASIEKIHNHLNGRLKISLVNANDPEIFVSRARATAFKKWLDK